MSKEKKVFLFMILLVWIPTLIIGFLFNSYGIQKLENTKESQLLSEAKLINGVHKAIRNRIIDDSKWIVSKLNLSKNIFELDELISNKKIDFAILFKENKKIYQYGNPPGIALFLQDSMVKDVLTYEDTIADVRFYDNEVYEISYSTVVLEEDEIGILVCGYNLKSDLFGRYTDFYKGDLAFFYENDLLYSTGKNINISQKDWLPQEIVDLAIGREREEVILLNNNNRSPKYFVAIAPIFDHNEWEISGFIGIVEPYTELLIYTLFTQKNLLLMVLVALFIVILTSINIYKANIKHMGIAVTTDAAKFPKKKYWMQFIIGIILPLFFMGIFYSFLVYNSMLKIENERIDTAVRVVESIDLPETLDIKEIKKLFDYDITIFREDELFQTTAIDQDGNKVVDIKIPQDIENLDDQVFEIEVNKIRNKAGIVRESGETFFILSDDFTNTENEIKNLVIKVFFSLLLGIIIAYIVMAYLIYIERTSLLRKTSWGYFFLAPSLIHLLIFAVGPIIFSLYLSFHRWNIIVPAKPYVGFENYLNLFQNAEFWNAMKNTAIYTLNVPLGMAFSLFIAIMMNQKIRGINFLRTIYFLPSVSSFVAIAMVWQWMYNPEFGIINYLLGKINIGPFPWLTSPNTALLSLMLMGIWINMGYQMVIFLAGLQGIPIHLYEAAMIDGGNRWNIFWHITLPLLRPTTFFVLVTSIIGSFQVFSSVYVMTGGGPARSTDVVVYYIYRNAWDYMKMGYSAAASWILFLIILFVTYLQFKYLKKDISYS
ncbi:sugar ABC transporter permease [bacterium]|nr:sugar ABC transporter permease [bacterium]